MYRKKHGKSHMLAPNNWCIYIVLKPEIFIGKIKDKKGLPFETKKKKNNKKKNKKT